MSDRPSRILRVDLSTETVESEPIPNQWREKYLGGKGLGARYLWEELQPGVDPLGPDNRLCFLLGPLSALLPGDARYAVVTKSPLSGTVVDSYAGGRFPATLTGALSDHLGLIIQGQADDPVRVEVEDNDAWVVPATTWGNDTVEVADAFPDADVACIGPAGERAVKFATISSDAGKHHAGRGGTGAVMGAKGLKVVLARGEPPDDHAALRATYEERYRETETGRWLDASDTLESVDVANEIGALAARGWSEGQFDGTSDIGIASVREASIGRDGSEPSPGGFRVETPDGEHVPRGATAMSLGAGLGIEDLEQVTQLGDRCNRFGIDVISAGSAVAWAMRAADDGLIDRDLTFGDATAARELLTEIAYRSTPLGDVLADGIDRAAARFGGEDLLPTVKSTALPAYDPRAAPSMALAYATSDRGACHRRARPVEEEPFDGGWTPAESARRVIAAQNERSVLWSLIVDDFAGDVLDDLGAEWLEAIGRDESPDDLRKMGERIWTLTRLFNLREGFDRADDTLPAVLRTPMTGGPADGTAIDPDQFAAMLTAYYHQRGWDDRGRPTPETLERLDLDELCADDPANLSVHR